MATGAAPPHLPRSQSLTCADRCPPCQLSLTALPLEFLSLVPFAKKDWLTDFMILNTAGGRIVVRQKAGNTRGPVRSLCYFYPVSCAPENSSCPHCRP